MPLPAWFHVPSRGLVPGRGLVLGVGGLVGTTLPGTDIYSGSLQRSVCILMECILFLEECHFISILLVRSESPRSSNDGV